jgi:hypothetical protein
MTKEEAHRLFLRLVAVQKEMSQHTTAVREINARLSNMQSVSISEDELEKIQEQLARHAVDSRLCAERGVKLYQRMSQGGFGTQQLDEWSAKVSADVQAV